MQIYPCGSAASSCKVAPSLGLYRVRAWLLLTPPHLHRQQQSLSVQRFGPSVQPCSPLACPCQGPEAAPSAPVYQSALSLTLHGNGCHLSLLQVGSRPGRDSMPLKTSLLRERQCCTFTVDTLCWHSGVSHLVCLFEALLVSIRGCLPLSSKEAVQLAKICLWVSLLHLGTLLITEQLHAPQRIKPLP